MRHRLLVMNGQRIVQSEQGGAWVNQKVEKAGALKPGIYNIYLAEKADSSQQYDGVIVHIEKSSIFQQIGRKFVVHDREYFDKLPEVGSAKSISYDASGRAKLAEVSAGLKRGRSR